MLKDRREGVRGTHTHIQTDLFITKTAKVIAVPVVVAKSKEKQTKTAEGERGGEKT